MRQFECKDMVGEISDVDMTARKVKAVWSRMNNVDLDMDIIMPGAFDKTIAECGPNGKNQIWSLIDHRASMGNAIGKPKELYIEGDMLIAITPILDTEIGEDILKMYQAGIINQHSIGFQTIKSDWQDQEQKVRLLKEVKLYEGSAVLWGANPMTPTLAITKDALKERIENLESAYKNGSFTDKTASRLFIEIEQLKTSLATLNITPAANAQEPQLEALLKAFKESNQKLQKLI